MSGVPQKVFEYTSQVKPLFEIIRRFLQTTSLNKYLTELMDGLTAKVFRTYNASMTLQEQLNKLTESEDNVNAKVLSYNRANRAVAILCNHQVCASLSSLLFWTVVLKLGRKYKVLYLRVVQFTQTDSNGIALTSLVFHS